MRKVMGIFKLTSSKINGKFKIPHFSGDEATKILEMADELIPLFVDPQNKDQKETFEAMTQIWKGWAHILEMSSRDEFSESDLVSFRGHINRWGNIFVEYMGVHNVTPYAHLVCAHWIDLIQLHGNLKKFSQDGLEASHRLHNLIYGRATNRSKGNSNGPSANTQIMQKIYRGILMETEHSVDLKR